MTDAEIKAALSDVEAVALTIWGEARAEAVEGRIAVGNVIRNRVDAGRFGEGYKAVCHKRWQFSCWIEQGGPANYAAVMEQARKMAEGKPVGGPTLLECLYLAEGIISRALLDNVKRATHYYAKYIAPPRWTKGHRPVKEIGGHLFYAGIA